MACLKIFPEDFCSAVKQMDCCMSRITGHMSWQQPYFVRFFSVFALFALNSYNYFLFVHMPNILLDAMKKKLKSINISSSQFPGDMWMLPARACSLGKKGYLITV